MDKYFAFLRAINVGGHTVRMEDLRQIGVGIGLQGVETFIASGNLVFDASPEPASGLEQKLTQALKAALGYEVATFIRSGAELAAITGCQPFPQAQMDAAAALNIAFLSTPPDEAARQKLSKYKTEIDDFAVHGREVYWLCRVKQSDSKFSNAALEKALGVQSTLRGVSTLRKLAAKYGLVNLEDEG